jgi:hypothetical protein
MSGKDVRVEWMEGLQAVQPCGRVEALAHERQTWRSHCNSEHNAWILFCNVFVSFCHISNGSPCITFLLRMTDIVTSQNIIDFSVLDILYIVELLRRQMNWKNLEGNFCGSSEVLYIHLSAGIEGKLRKILFSILLSRPKFEPRTPKIWLNIVTAVITSSMKLLLRPIKRSSSLECIIINNWSPVCGFTVVVLERYPIIISAATSSILVEVSLGFILSAQKNNVGIVPHLWLTASFHMLFNSLFIKYHLNRNLIRPTDIVVK